MVAEKGRIEELLAPGYRYKAMWEKLTWCRAERAAEEARVATTKHKLLRQANIPGASREITPCRYNSLASSAFLQPGATYSWRGPFARQRVHSV